MKQIIALILIFFSLLAPKIFAQESWTIDSFNSDITIQPDGNVAVLETINVDFKTLEKHGIYREIPISYADSDQTIYSQVDSITVLQDMQKAAIQETKNENFIVVLIGDPDRTISGKHTYQISYTVNGILRSFAGHDELYWNVTGNDWEAPIMHASASVTLPTAGLLDTKCYQGFSGSSDACTAEQTSDINAAFAATKTLTTGEGMTLVAGWQKGLVPIITVEKPKSFWELLFEPLSTLFFLTALLLGGTAVILLWFKRGRDMWWGMLPSALVSEKTEKEKPLFAKQALVVEYTPPEKLRPAEIGVLTDERADTHDVVATIIDLATRGYFTITEIQKKWLFGSVDYELHRKTKSEDDLLPFEKYLLQKLFLSKTTVKISSLKRTFYDELKETKTKLYESVVTKKFFPKNPEKVRLTYYLLGICTLVLSGICIFLGLQLMSGSLGAFGIGGILGSMLLLLMARNMPRRTAEGFAMLQRIKGYRLFIATAEKHRQQFFENKNLFNEVLPYAIVFGLTDKFAKAMQDIGLPMKQTTWYHGTTAFHAATFGNHINAFSSSLSQSIAASPKSSGFSSSGSSGGGFGGGGGGSW